MLIGSLVGLGLFAGSFRRVWLLLPALALALLVATSTVAAGEIETQVKAAQANIVGSPPDWIDRATSSPVSYVYNGEVYWNTVWQERFWNTRIHNVLALWPSAVPGPMTQTQVTPPASGLLPTTDHYIVASDVNEFFGTPVAHIAETGLDVAGLTLWHLAGPARLSLVTNNIQANGDIYLPASVTVYDCRGGALHLTLLPKATRVVRVTLNGKLVLRQSIAGLKFWNGTVSAPPSAEPRKCVFTITGQTLLGSTVVAFSSLVVGADADEHLADVLAAEEPRKCARQVVEPVDDRLAIRELPFAQPGTRLGQELGEPLVVVEDDEPLDRAGAW